jgi:hypothetical protein
MEPTQADNIRQLRAAILKLVYENQQEQRSRLRVIQLAGALSRLFYEFEDLNELKAVLQDLKERGYVQFTEEREKFSRKVEFGPISITPDGRDLVELTNKDAAVDFS